MDGWMDKDSLVEQEKLFLFTKIKSHLVVDIHSLLHQFTMHLWIECRSLNSKLIILIC